MHLYALRRRTVGRLLLAAVITLITGVMVLHHSGLASAGHHDDGDHGAAVSLCVGTAVAVVAIEGLLLLRRSRLNTDRRRRLPVRRELPRSIALPVTAAAPARAGPPLHLQLCVIRR